MANEVETDDRFRNESREVLPFRRPEERVEFDDEGNVIDLMPGPEVMPRDPARTATSAPEVMPRHPSAYVPEVQARDDLSAFVTRLSSLGATLDQIEEVKARWDTWDDDLEPGAYRKDELVRLDDGSLMAMINESTQEFVAHTMTEEEQADASYREAVAANMNEAQLVVVNSAVDGVLDWVGDDAARARAAWIAEQTVPDHTARKGVVENLARRFEFGEEVDPIDPGD